MADRRKRGAPVGLMPSPRPRQRFRPCVCVFSSHPFWTSMDVPAGVTQEEGHTGFFLIHLPSAVRALIFVATLQSFIGHNCCIWFVLVVLLVSAALRRVLVTNSILPLQSFIGHNYCIWNVVVVLLVSAALRSPCDRLPFTTTIVHWTQLLYMVRSCGS